MAYHKDEWVAGMDEMCDMGPSLFTSEERRLLTEDRHQVYWNEDMGSCPRGVKVQLMGSGGIAMYGIYDGKSPFFLAWCAMPARRPR